MPAFVVVVLLILAAFWRHLIMYNYNLHYMIMMLRFVMIVICLCVSCPSLVYASILWGATPHITFIEYYRFRLTPNSTTPLQ